MKKKEKLLLIEIHRELRCFLYLSRQISRLSRDLVNMPSVEIIKEHKVSGRRLIDLHNKLTAEVTK